jgi:hypothetical protein
MADYKFFVFTSWNESLIFQGIYSQDSINIILIDVKSSYLLRKVYFQGCAN